MKYAETGFSLEIDLSLGRIEKLETDPRDGEGIPTRQTLERLDLAYAADDLERRGILAAAAAASATEPAATAG